MLTYRAWPVRYWDTSLERSHVPIRPRWWAYHNYLQPYGGPGGARGSFCIDMVPFQGNIGIQTPVEKQHTSTGPAHEIIHRVRGRELYSYQHDRHVRTPTEAMVEQQVESGTPLPGVVWALAHAVLSLQRRVAHM